MALRLQLAVIADDLTGALDAVVVFANLGMRCVTATTPAHLQAALEQDPDVIAVSTNSRGLVSTKAATMVAEVGQALKHVPILFKKIDSRLKGNIAAEVGALARVAGYNRALICPAIPQMDRTVANGFLQGFGVDQPIQVSSVMSKVTGLLVTAPDAATDSDIDQILNSLMPGTLLVGAQGLCAGLARLSDQSAPNPISLPLPQPVVFVIGSRDPITLAQVAHLRQSEPRASYLAAPNGIGADKAAPSGLTIIQATSCAIMADPKSVSQELAKSYRFSFPSNPTCLVLTGGETAAAILAQMDLGVLEVLGEALPGLPMCRGLGLNAEMLIVTKSGGFGDTEILSWLVAPNSAPQC